MSAPDQETPAAPRFGDLGLPEPLLAALAAVGYESPSPIQAVGRVAGSALQVHQALLARPINTIARLSADTRHSVPAVTSSIAALTELGLVREITGRKRGRVFAYGPYLEVLQQGTEPL